VRLRGLYAIADTATLGQDRVARAVARALEGGARAVQYRDKSDDAARRQREVEELVTICRRYAAPLIVNDDVELAVACGADGVHLGRGDATVEAARARLGAGATIGVSCYDDLARALDAAARGADYIAFGSFFPSRTKPQAVRAPLELLREAHARLAVPMVAIGGITPENGASLIAAGADALAVIEGVFNQPDIRAAAERYARLFAATLPETTG
jgi:thiamine-phosphate pyrophosphorylase